MSENRAISFLRAGMQSLIQDSGRSGLAHLGVPQSGFADRSSAAFANSLVGNPIDAALLEICILGPTIVFEDNIDFAISGALFEQDLNGKKISKEQLYSAGPGDVLSFGRVLKGCRAYLAFSGEILGQKLEHSFSPLFYNSPEVYSFPYMVKGRRLEFKERNVITDPNIQLIENTELEVERISVLPGPESGEHNNILSWLLSEKFTLRAESNRMALKLNTDYPFPSDLHQIRSAGVLPGVIQLDHTGHPIVLMPDAQTTGGYPRIAVIKNKDLDKCAQLRPGASVTFELG